MKILHIWDQAGTASLISKYQRDYLHYEKSAVIQDGKHDRLNISKYYNCIVYSGKIPFLIHALSASRLYDIIHLHDAYFMIIPLKLFYPWKKIIIHYHGSLIRMNTLGQFRFKLEQLVDKILVATPDLLDYPYQKPPLYVPDPIDNKLFSSKPRPTNNRAFALLKITQSDNDLRKLLINLGYCFHLETQQRIKGYTNGTQYANFPEKLNQYEYYVDIPTYNGEIIHAHSCAGLQALSLGLKVICHDGTIKTGLPKQHTPESVVNYLNDIYEHILKK